LIIIIVVIVVCGIGGFILYRKKYLSLNLLQPPT